MTEKNNAVSKLIKKNLSNLALLCDSRIFSIRKRPFPSAEFSGTKLAAFKDLSQDLATYYDHGLLKKIKKNDS